MSVLGCSMVRGVETEADPLSTVGESNDEGANNEERHKGLLCKLSSLRLANKLLERA
jgi:hypothetical protein